jgi:hypothetical protein
MLHPDSMSGDFRFIGWSKLGRFHIKQTGEHIYSVTCVGRHQWSIGRVHQVTNESEWLSYLFKHTPVLALNRLEAQCLAEHYSLAFAHPVVWCRWKLTPNTNMNLRQTNNLYVERDVNA